MLFKVRSWVGVLSLFLAIAGAAAATAAEFPYREKFKHVPVLEIADLHKVLDTVNLVDVRSRYEYETLHVKGAAHIPLSRDKFLPAVQELQRSSTNPIVFYCNGTTCKKSYEAAELAIKAGVANVFAYDAGLDAWTHAYPEASVLLGRTPTKNNLIAADKFKRHVISPEAFEARVAQGAVVLDIRDLRQRDVALFPFKEKRAQLDEREKIADAVQTAKREGKTLLVYDKVGKQTRWFQYYLEQQGLTHYYFMDGGAEGYHEAKYGKLNFARPDQS